MVMVLNHDDACVGGQIDDDNDDRIGVTMARGTIMIMAVVMVMVVTMKVMAMVVGWG